MLDQFSFHLGENKVKCSLQGVEVESNAGPDALTKHFTTENLVRNVVRRSFGLTIKRIPYIGFFFSMIFVFVRLVRNPLSVKTWCIAIMEMASGAISIFAYTNWIVPLLLDLTIIVIDGFDVVFEGESSRFNEADSIEVASRNIAKISLVFFE